MSEFGRFLVEDWRGGFTVIGFWAVVFTLGHVAVYRKRWF